MANVTIETRLYRVVAVKNVNEISPTAFDASIEVPYRSLIFLFFVKQNTVSSELPDNRKRVASKVEQSSTTSICMRSGPRSCSRTDSRALAKYFSQLNVGIITDHFGRGPLPDTGVMLGGLPTIVEFACSLDIEWPRMFLAIGQIRVGRR